jgi:putative membrane protein
MKKLNLIIAAALSIGMLQACHNGAKDSTQTADSVNAAKDTSKMADSSAKDTTKMAATTPDNDDSKFCVTAADAGMTEIALSKAALTITSNAKIKDFANMMITDHTAAANKLMALCKAKGIALPNAPSANHQKAIDDISKKTGADFDKAFVDQMVKDHKGAVSLFTGESKNAVDPDLKAFATSTLPTLQGHLDAITAIKKDM